MFSQGGWGCFLGLGSWGKERSKVSRRAKGQTGQSLNWELWGEWCSVESCHVLTAQSPRYAEKQEAKARAAELGNQTSRCAPRRDTC